MQSQVAFENQVIQAVKYLPPQKIQDVVDYANFLRWKEIREDREIVEFDEWAVNLAKEKGFDKLTEDDVVKIVHECRREF